MYISVRFTALNVSYLDLLLEGTSIKIGIPLAPVLSGLKAEQVRC